MTKYLFFVAIGLFPFLSSAATYHYVTTGGEVAAVEAPTAEVAIDIAPNRASNSGVAIDRGDIDPDMEVPVATNGGASNGQLGTGGSNTYHYVTTSGMTALVEAPNPQIALAIAPNRAPNSGVAINDGVIESGMEVESVAD